jgi:hypothetical protein
MNNWMVAIVGIFIGFTSVLAFTGPRNAIALDSYSIECR